MIWRSDAGDFPVILTNTGALHPEYGLFAPTKRKKKLQLKLKMSGCVQIYYVQFRMIYEHH